MAAIDTLNANITALTTAVTAVAAEVQTLQGNQGVPEAQVQAAADAVAAQTTALQALIPAPAPHP